MPSADLTAVRIVYQEWNTVSNKYIPRSGLHVQLRDMAAVLVEDLTETPADSGQYSAVDVTPGVYYIWDDTVNPGTPENTDKKIIVGAVSEDAILDDSISTDKIQNGAITEAKIFDGSVAGGKIPHDAISEDHIQDNAVRSNHIIDNAVTEAKIVDAAITEVKIDEEAVTTNKIDENAVTMQKIDEEIRQELQYMRAMLDAIGGVDDYTVDHYAIDLEAGVHTNTVFLRTGLQVVDLASSGNYVAPQLDPIDTTNMINAYLKGVINIESGASINFRIQGLHDVNLDDDIATYLTAATTFDVDIQITPVASPPANVFLQNLDLYIVRKP